MAKLFEFHEGYIVSTRVRFFAYTEIVLSNVYPITVVVSTTSVVSFGFILLS